jgi:hypothetical protein
MTVYFVQWDTGRDLMEEANRLYDAAGTFDCVEKGDLVAVKVASRFSPTPLLTTTRNATMGMITWSRR